MRVAGTVRLHHCTLHSQQRRAAHLRVIHQLFDPAEGRLADGAGNFAPQIRHHLLFDDAHQRPGNAFHEFQHQIATEAVRHQNIRLIPGNIPCFHISHKMIGGLFHQGIGGLHQGIPLFRLRSDIDQADAWLFQTHDAAHIRFAHHSELNKIFRLAVHIGSAVNQQEISLSVGQQRRKSRPLDTGNPAQPEHASGEHGAGASG